MPRAAAAPPAAARWVFRPRGPQPISARTELDSGEMVVDRGGSRWLLRSAGPPEPAPYGAPEALVAARPDGAGFAFVGESGAVYWAEAALGPFVAVRHPPEVSFGAVAHEDVVLAVGQDGRLRRSSDLGRSWQVVAVDAFVVDVALDRAGRALALSVPEQWFWSEDRGQSFRPVSPRSVAPRELVGGSDHVQVSGWLESYEFDGSDFRPSQSRPAAQASWTLPRGPSAAEVRSGRAALGADFVGLIRQGAGFVLAQAELGGAEREQPAHGLSDCAQQRLTRRGDRLAVVCANAVEPGVSVPLVLWQGDAGSARFERHPVPLRGDFERVRLALSPAGAVALSGICPPDQVEAGCMPRGVHRVVPGKRELSALPSPLSETPAALEFGDRGELFATSVRQKDGHAVVLVWEPGRASSPELVDLSIELDLALRVERVELLVSQKRPWGALVHHTEGTTALGLDARGRPLVSGPVPSQAGVVHGAGLRLLAVDLERGVLLESLDGGLTWAESSLPRSPCPPQKADCAPALVCSDAGCLLGDELTRVGWGSELASAPAKADGRRQRGRERAAADEYSCQISGEKALYLPHLLEVPGAAEAALGGADFTAVEYDAETGAVDFVWAPRGQVRLERQAALSPVKEPERYALAIVPQVEGSAALRYRTPIRQTGDRMLSEIEVAWNNRVRGLTGRHRLPSVVEGRAGDYQAPASGPGEAFPELLSVADRGLYLALHRSGSGSQPTLYFEGSSVETLPAPALPSVLGNLSDVEYVRIEGQHLPLVFADSRSKVLLGGPLGGAAARPPGVALLLGDVPVGIDRAQGMRLAYRGERIGVLSMMADLDGEYWTARFAELEGGTDRALSGVTRAPLKPDLTPMPAWCSEEVRLTTPRVVAPPFPGPTPRLRVTHGSAELGQFVLGAAVLHGTPEAACLAAWAGEGTGERHERRQSGVLLVPAEQGLGGWVFIERDRERSNGGFDAWPLSCALGR